MKINMKKISAVIISAISILSCPIYNASASENDDISISGAADLSFTDSAEMEVTYETNEDRSKTVITEKNWDFIRKYELSDAGGGTKVEMYNSFYVSAVIEDRAILPENICTEDRDTLFKAPETDGEFISENGISVFTIKKARKLAEQLKEINGISDIQIYQKQCLTKCWLYENWYIPLNAYEFNIDDFADITEKGFDVSLNEYGYISIIPPEYDVNNSDIHQANYQGMLAAMEIQQSKGISLMPYIYCQTLSDIKYEKVDITTGDVNEDGTFSVADIVMLQSYLTKKNNTSDYSRILKCADMNGDGSIDVFDLILMKRKVMEEEQIPPENDNAEELPADDTPELGEIFCGDTGNSSKPLPSQRIAVRCNAFYEHGEKVIIDAAMGDDYSYYMNFGGGPSYDTFGVNGHPEYLVFTSDIFSSGKTDDDRMIINGENGRFIKEFSKDEMNSLDITGKYGEYALYHHELTEIDFSGYEVGSSGDMYIGFFWKYDKNPYSAGKYSGMEKILGFYVGEKGVMLSACGHETAQNEYMNAFEKNS